MTDPYLRFANSALGGNLAGTLGLPKPPRLERYRPGQAVIEGEVILGTAQECHAGQPLLSSVLQALADMKATVLSHGAAPSWVAEANRAGLMVGRFTPPAKGSTARPVKALVFDASNITDSAQLGSLYHFFHDTVRSLGKCARILILGRPPESCATPRQATAQRALEGMTRSLGKEVRRGCTAQLVYVAEGAEGGIDSTLRFLLSPRSAYVSGQVIRIGAVATASKVADWSRPLQGQTALVTGVSRGIGASIAEVLARDGAKVICVDVPQAEAALHEVAKKLDGIALPLDVTTADAPQKMVAAAQAHGGIDILVHNAGIARDKTIALLAAQAIKRGGRIVCVSSISGIAGNMGQTNYAVSKAGVIGMVHSMAPRLREHAIAINAVAPGFIETQMTDAIPFTIRTAARLMNSMNQGGQTVDVAETIAWFA